MLALLLLIPLVLSQINAASFGPQVTATKGEVWPKPLQEKKTNEYFIIKPHSFTFLPPENIGCPDLLNEALKRYWTLIAITGSLTSEKKETNLADDNFIGYLDSLSIVLTEECPGDDVLPAFGDAENYTLTVSSQGNTLLSPSIWGILRGLETFSQLVYKIDDELRINSTVIEDSPRFSHRGLLIDTARHYLPVNILLQVLDGMSYNKFNVLHWHLTDDQSFPFQSRTYPELSNQGAYHPAAKIYDAADVKNVIEYARLRGIRVVPEFDTPGHTSSWGPSHPELLTSCYDADGPTGELGPMDPSTSAVYDFLDDFFKEVVETFPDEYFHIGGDEVDFSCWQSSPKISDFMNANNLTTYEEVESYFIQNVVGILDNLNSKYMVWEEVFSNGVILPNSTVVQVWKDGDGGLATLNQVTAAGKFGIYSSCWYLDYLQKNWEDYYQCEPLDFDGTEEQKKLVLGGEACMWAEVVNEYNIIPRVFPRASAAAERLWSAQEVNDPDAAKSRLEEHTCRMNTRGINAQPPNGAGACL